MRILPRLAASCFFLGALLAVPAQIPGTPATDTPAPTETEPEPQVPSAIAAADVPARAEVIVAELGSIAPRLEISPDVISISEQVSGLADQALDFRTEKEALLDAGDVTYREMEELRRQVGRFRAQVEEWQGKLAKRSEELTLIKDDLAWASEEWRLTLEQAEDDEDGFPEALIERTRSILAAVEDAASDTRARLDDVLTLQNQLSEAAVSMNAFEVRIDAAGEQYRHGLLYRDSPPLWAPEAEAWSGVTLGSQLRASKEEVERVVREWWHDYRDRVGYHVALLVVLLVVLLVLDRRLRARSEADPSVEAARAMLSRPLPAALVLFLIASFWFYDPMPRLADECVLLLLLPPVLWLIHDLIRPEIRRPMYVMAALYCVHFVTRAAPDDSPLQRVALLIVGIGGLATITWILRRSRALQESRPPTRVRVGAALLRVSSALLVVALIANVVGIVGLARVLTGGTVVSSWLALILYAARLVVVGAIAMLVRTEPLIRLAGIRRHRDLVERRADRVVQVVLAILWIEGTLYVFGILEPSLAFLQALFTDPLPFPGEVEFSLGNILAFVLTLWGASLLSRFIRFILDEDVLPKLPLPRGVPAAISKGLNYLIMTAGFLLAVMATGIDVNKFTLLAGAFGVGLGFGMQNIVNNFVSGLILLFERPVQVGDTVEIGTLIGRVREIGIRSSTVRTFEGAEVIVPNGILIADQVVNWTLSDRQRRIEIPVGVAYGTDPHVVIEILLDVARKHPQAMTDPSPVALFQGFGESSLDFILRFWTTNFDDWVTIRSEAILAIHDALKAAGIEIPFPQRDVHVRTPGPEGILGEAGRPSPPSRTDEHDGS